MKQMSSSNKHVIQEAAKVLKQDGVIIYPTDTVYGLGADATNKVAVEEISKIKGRGQEKTFLVMVSDLEMLKEYAEVYETAEKLVEEFLPGALTLILSAKGDKLKAVERPGRSVGFRIPNHAFCNDITEKLERPIVSTSANISGQPTPDTALGALEQLKEKAESVDMVIDGGKVTSNTPSTIVDARNEKIVILREGAIPKELLTHFI